MQNLHINCKLYGQIVSGATGGEFGGMVDGSTTGNSRESFAVR